MKKINNEIKNKTVLVRVDYNVPIKNNKVESNFRIKTSLDTINLLLENKNKVVLMTHLGRPKGKVDKKLRLDPIKKELENLTKKEILKLDDCINQKQKIKNAKEEIILLENLRFHKGEKRNGEKFAKELAKQGDIFVFDAFSVSHRKHASTYQITNHIESFYGLRLKKELDNLKKVTKNPEKPLSVIMGGAKLSTKLPAIKQLIDKSENIFIGGAMAFTFIKAMGYEIGNSLYEKEFIDNAKELLKTKKIIIPKDFVCLIDGKDKTLSYKKIKGIGLDIGKKSIKQIKKISKKSKTILWNGPMGKFEDKRYSKGTKRTVNILSESKSKVICGGGETLQAIQELKKEDSFYFLSTGGGALLNYLENQKIMLEEK
ncbi:MAG: phosphoglycerate kinase [Candidatus Woesearchaeota archaeon]